jgi:predicted alpha/beta-hydrolase family hydrolase
MNDRDSAALTFTAVPAYGDLSAILDRSESSRALLVLGHGSGSTMSVPFIAGLSDALVHAGVATFRYQYPYSEDPGFVPYSDMPMNEPDVMVATVRAAVANAAAAAPDLPLFAGGHSVSGRLTSEADAETSMDRLHGILLLGFPLKGDMSRVAHFSTASKPLLFVQGTNDAYADSYEMQQVADDLGIGSELHFVDGADHGFAVPGRRATDVLGEIADLVSRWTHANS